MRRQNRSCDQCRKAKRACDAPSLWDIQRNSERLRNGGDSTSGTSLAEEHLGELVCSPQSSSSPSRAFFPTSTTLTEGPMKPQMRLIPELYDVHTAFVLANNAHFTGFALNYRLALLPQAQISTTKYLLRMAHLAASPISRAQRPSVNVRALSSSNQDLRRLKPLYQRTKRLMLMQLPCWICCRHLPRHTTCHAGGQWIQLGSPTSLLSLTQLSIPCL